MRKKLRQRLLAGTRYHTSELASLWGRSWGQRDPESKKRKIDVYYNRTTKLRNKNSAVESAISDSSREIWKWGLKLLTHSILRTADSIKEFNLSWVGKWRQGPKNQVSWWENSPRTEISSLLQTPRIDGTCGKVIGEGASGATFDPHYSKRMVNVFKTSPDRR